MIGTLRFAHPTLSTDQWVINGYFHNLSGVGAIAGGEARRQGPRQPGGFTPIPAFPPKGKAEEGRGGLEAEPRGPVVTGAWGEAWTPNQALLVPGGGCGGFRGALQRSCPAEIFRCKRSEGLVFLSCQAGERGLVFWEERWQLLP
jgi:hypothetical protein